MIKPIHRLPVFKERTSDKTPSYKDPFRKIHTHNQEIVKNNKRIEKLVTHKYIEEKKQLKIQHDESNSKENIEKYRLLNIV